MAGEKSTRGRDSPVTKNLSTKVTSQGAISSGIPLHGACSSSKHVEGGDLKVIAFMCQQASPGEG
jgi:hypothetical protein